MWKVWIVLLCTAGTSPVLLSNAQNFDSAVATKNKASNNRQNDVVRRFACPIGFFRLKRYCYYLSAGTAPWREAHFHCKDRNATLAVLDRNGKDRMLRRYLMGDQFTKLERWIGGIYNWQQMAWEWGVTGEKMIFQSFAKVDLANSQRYAWHCAVLDPAFKYKWSAKSCIEKKHYICEVSAGRISKRRKKTIDPFAPQNQRLKPRKQGKKYLNSESRKSNKRNEERMNWRNRAWSEQQANHQSQWAHGVNLGSRPPVRSKALKQRIRHRSNETSTNLSAPRVAQILPRGREYGAFLGDSPNRRHDQAQSLSDVNNVLSQFQAKINDFAREEVLLKPD